MVLTFVVGACTLPDLWICFGWIPVGNALEDMGLQENVRAAYAVSKLGGQCWCCTCPPGVNVSRLGAGDGEGRKMVSSSSFVPGEVSKGHCPSSIGPDNSKNVCLPYTPGIFQTGIFML